MISLQYQWLSYFGIGSFQILDVKKQVSELTLSKVIILNELSMLKLFANLPSKVLLT